jgi:c-di-GMP-binding flagellar brake protein YcgR
MEELSKKYASGARQFKRYSISTVIKVIVIRNTAKIMMFGRTDNLSECGLALYTPQELKIDEPIQLELEVPASKTSLKLAGKVKNNINGAYGVEFVDMFPRQRQELIRACEALATVQGKELHLY